MARNEPLLAAVVGPQGSGKTSLLGAACMTLRRAGLVVGGVTQPVILDRLQRAGYLLRDEGTGETRPFAHRATAAHGRGQGFLFEPDGWSWAAKRILLARRSAQVVVVDELGLLEAQGQGHLPSLLVPLPAETARLWLLAVRLDAVQAIMQRLGPFHLQVDAIRGPEALLARIAPLWGGPEEEGEDR